MSNFFGLVARDQRTPARETAVRSESKAGRPHVSFPAGKKQPQQHDRGKSASGKRPVMIATKKLKKSYRKGDLTLPVLRGVDMQVRTGELVSIIGQSGSGKSTLLHLLGTLDQPDSGEIFFEDSRIDNLPAAGRDRLRNQQFGMIFQFYHLLPELTMLENVLTPIMISYGALRYWKNRRKFVERAEHLLELVGLSHRMKHRPRELSGGRNAAGRDRARTDRRSTFVARRRTNRKSRPKNGSRRTRSAAIIELRGKPHYSHGYP